MEQVAHNLVIQMFFVVGTPVLMKEKSIPTVTEKNLKLTKVITKKIGMNLTNEKQTF